jgi:PhzF family phenazine biosynthesis protein
MNNIIYHVDAFTSEPFSGNPAGVFITSGELVDEYMQTIAAELNLSETAFLTPVDDGFKIRFYTPEAEIDLCGHATLSAAHILYEQEIVPRDTILKFESKAGILSVQNINGLIVMDFPLYKYEKVDIPEDFNENTGLSPKELYKCDYNWFMAILDNEQDIIDASPDFTKLKSSAYNHLIITALSAKKDIDFIVRCFVPGLGINEDPVTGSAHCALTPYWADITSKKEFTSYQASSRGGFLRVGLDGETVRIAGNAITILQSELKA